MVEIVLSDEEFVKLWTMECSNERNIGRSKDWTGDDDSCEDFQYVKNTETEDTRGPIIYEHICRHIGICGLRASPRVLF